MDRLSVTSRKMVTYTRVDCVGASKVKTISLCAKCKAVLKIFSCVPKYLYIFKINQM